MTKQELLVRGAFIGTALAGLAYLSHRKNERSGLRPVDTGLSVTPLCNTYTITDKAKLERAFAIIVGGKIREGIKDAQAISYAFLRQVAPACTSSSTPENPGQALLRFLTWVDTAQELKRLNVITDTEEQAEIYRAKAWAVSNGVAPNHEALRDPETTGLVEQSAPPDVFLTCEPPMIPAQRGDGEWECVCPPGQRLIFGDDGAPSCA
jgi:hypothetical protein